MWKAGSGIAHGDMWATLSIMQTIEIPGPVPEIATMRIAANMKTLFALTFTAVDMTATAWKLLDSRARTRVESTDAAGRSRP